jgi:hypothetical protein
VIGETREEGWARLMREGHDAGWTLNIFQTMTTDELERLKGYLKREVDRAASEPHADLPVRTGRPVRATRRVP